MPGSSLRRVPATSGPGLQELQNTSPLASQPRGDRLFWQHDEHGANYLTSEFAFRTIPIEPIAESRRIAGS